MIEYKVLRPSEFIFKEYINSYTYSFGSLSSISTKKNITRTIPTFYTQLYFEFGGDISQLVYSKNKTIITKRTYLNAGISKWYDIEEIENDNNKILVKNLKVDLFPYTIYELFGLSPYELLNEFIEIYDIWPIKTDYRNMIDEMEYCKDGSCMIQIFEKYFIKLLKKRKEIKHRNMFPSYSISLNNLSNEIGYSKRWIQKEYKDKYGIKFNEMQKNMRFLKVLNKLKDNREINFSLIALECGYYDQSHFIRDFKSIIGLTPSEFLRKNKIIFHW